MIRSATPDDAAAIGAVHEAAFGRPDEAALVAALVADGDAVVSLVAVGDDGAVAGHVLLSRATAGAADVLALAPLGVLPAAQRRGHGRALVRAALEAARASAFAAVVVLGHPAFYGKLGFEPARRLGLRAPFEVAPEAFRAARLPAWPADPPARATVRYAPAFAAL